VHAAPAATPDAAGDFLDACAGNPDVCIENLAFVHQAGIPDKDSAHAGASFWFLLTTSCSHLSDMI